MAKKAKVKVDLALAKAVLSVVDKGLVEGIGKDEPGKMCVEAAVAYASGENHNDHPSCVHHDLADIKIELNDTWGWPSDKARAKGLRRVAIAQLGSAKKFNRKLFAKLMLKDLENSIFSEVAKTLAEAKTKKHPLIALEKLGFRTTEVGTINLQDDDAGEAIAYAGVLRYFYAKSSRLKNLNDAAEAVVRVLKKMRMPGTRYLHLTEKGRKTKVARRKK